MVAGKPLGLMDDSCSITPKKIDELLHFLPLFDQPGRKFVERWQSSPGNFAYPVYPADVQEFFRLASQPCWCDRQYDPEAASKMLADPLQVDSASLNQVKSMLTYCVRGERFGDGFWEQVLEQGQIIELLRRLAVLKGEL
jgi:hypothetical protein